jgi:hypothetical protein
MRLVIAHRVTAAIPPNKQLHPTRVPLRFTRAAVLLPIFRIEFVIRLG